jgi:GTPase SAR1 family protein
MKLRWFSGPQFLSIAGGTDGPLIRNRYCIIIGVMLWSKQSNSSTAEAEVPSTSTSSSKKKGTTTPSKKSGSGHIKYQFTKNAASTSAEVEMRPGTCLYISGFCYVTLLQGCASVGNYSLRHNVRQRVYAPCWSPAWRLDCRSSSDVFSELSAEMQTKLLVESIDSEEQEWMVLVEDKTPYKVGATDPSTKFVLESTSDKIVPFKCTLGSAIVGCETVIKGLDIDIFSISDSWKQCFDNVAHTCHVQSLTEAQNCCSPKILICGAKGVGKSSCLKLLVNSLLSTTQSVCVIDFDCGQPEFSCPGTFSLHVIKSPCLAPSHLNLQGPELSYFCGELSTKACPEFLFAVMRELVQKYEQIRDEIIHTIGKQAELAVKIEKSERKVKKAKSEVFANRFDALDSNFHKDVDRLKSLTTDEEHAMRKDYQDRTKFPLIINTDGFIRYFGAEILKEIVSVFEPTHVVHLSSLKDRELPALAPLRSPDSKVVIYTLEPGRIGPSRITAVDMRTLRFVIASFPIVYWSLPLSIARMVSYFLRSSSVLRILARIIRTNNESSAINAAETASVSLLSNNSKHLIKLIQAVMEQNPPGTVTLSIKTGNIIDNYGIIPLVLQSSNCYAAPFSSIAFAAGSASIPPRLILASMNAGLVALESVPTSFVDKCRPSSSVTNDSESRTVGSLVRLRTTVSNEDEDLLGADGLTREGQLTCFDIDYVSSSSGVMPLCPTMGLGIVARVDMPDQALHVIGADPSITDSGPEAVDLGDGDDIETAVDPKAVHLHSVSLCRKEEFIKEKVLIVRGENVQLPAAFSYSPSSPMLPYYCGESVGEGSNEMKVRRTMKRRSQANN